MDTKEDQRSKVLCECSEQCGNAFNVPKKTVGRAKAQRDILISLTCPHIERYDLAIIESLEGFAVVSTLGESG
ncbi:hypothetical protein DRH13_04290 [Candidatus Woesebacteria bacterium]|nr:MAG: hypothetical protein DRH13_04290 [Candidatus Woesebacteria bacterium]